MFTASKRDVSNAVRWYIKGEQTLRQIADRLGTNHHMIRRLLVRQGVEISRRQQYRPRTAEHRRKLSEAGKGRVPWCAGLKLPEAMRRANMKAKLKTSIDLDRYPDFDRLKILTKQLAKRKKHLGQDDAARLAFLDRFYFDPSFNAVYDAWIRSGRNKWYYPSLDHKCAKCNGGGWALDNLCFLTWFENRAKADMSDAEWAAFKRATNTRSDLFVESLVVHRNHTGGTSHRREAQPEYAGAGQLP